MCSAVVIVNVTSPLNVVVGTFSDEAELRDVPMGRPFDVPAVKITELEEALSDFDIEQLKQVIRRLQDQCLIVRASDNHFRLVHPIMIQQYREDKQKNSGLTMELMRMRILANGAARLWSALPSLAVAPLTMHNI